MVRRLHVASESLEGSCSQNTYVVNLSWGSTTNGVSNADTVDTDLVHCLIQGQQIHQV